MKLLLVAISACTVACATAAPETPAPAPAAAATQVQTPPADAGLKLYEGTYSLQAPNRVLELRVWIDAEGKLNGELVGLGQQTTFRPTDTPHKFLHETRDDISFLFTVENGRSTAATMTSGARQASGARIK